MQISPVQTKSIIYRRVHIAPLLDENGQILSGLKAPNFDWAGVKLAVEAGTGIREGQESPTDFLVSLRIQVSSTEEPRCPYEIDVEIVALLNLNARLPESRREELASVNGLAIAYGAMRELIVNVTSRMEYGALVMPGVNFQDHLTAPEEKKAITPSSEE